MLPPEFPWTDPKFVALGAFAPTVMTCLAAQTDHQHSYVWIERSGGVLKNPLTGQCQHIWRDRAYHKNTVSISGGTASMDVPGRGHLQTPTRGAKNGVGRSALLMTSGHSPVGAFSEPPTIRLRPKHETYVDSLDPLSAHQART
jgi:hypothetical protein